MQRIKAIFEIFFWFLCVPKKVFLFLKKTFYYIGNTPIKKVVSRLIKFFISTFIIHYLLVVYTPWKNTFVSACFFFTLTFISTLIYLIIMADKTRRKKYFDIDYQKSAYEINQEKYIEQSHWIRLKTIIIFCLAMLYGLVVLCILFIGS